MGSVGSIDYIVEPEESHWTVNFGGQHCGCFASRLQALRSAASDADRVRNLGHQVRILVRYAGGARLRIIAERPRSIRP